MPDAWLNGVRLSYTVVGDGEPVLLIMGSGARAQVWHVHQVPALSAAGYQVVTFDLRGVPPSEVPEGPYTIEQLTDDTIALVEDLGLPALRLAGVSLGAVIAQEVAIARPDLLRGMALLATRGRDDVARAALARAERQFTQARTELPAEYGAVVQALQMLSPRTLDDDEQATLWLQTFALYPAGHDGLMSRLRLDPMPNRLDALRGVRVPSTVIGFADDLITPPKLCREVADAIPGCRYVEIAGCGHLGHLERPDAVNTALLDFFRGV